MLISTDQEQGVVVRVGEPATQFPGAMALGATRSTDSAGRAAVITGRELRAIGSNQRINEPVYRILEVKQKRGLFENPYVDEGAVDAHVGAPQNRATARSIADKTVTLVKNDAGTLPLTANTGRSVLVTGAGGIPGSTADRSTLDSLADLMRQRGTTTAVFETGSSPSDAAIEEAKTRAGQNDLLVVITNKASISPGQQKLVKALLGTGKPVVVAATHDPYDIAYFAQAPTYLATYGYRAVSMGSLARVLFGEVDPSGKLPVRIPAAGAPGTTLYLWPRPGLRRLEEQGS